MLNSALSRNKKLSKIKQNELKEIKKNVKRKYQLKLQKIIHVFKSEFKSSVSKNLFVYKCKKAILKKSKTDPSKLTYEEISIRDCNDEDYDSQMVTSAHKMMNHERKASAFKDNSRRRSF